MAKSSKARAGAAADKPVRTMLHHPRRHRRPTSRIGQKNPSIRPHGEHPGGHLVERNPKQSLV